MTVTGMTGDQPDVEWEDTPTEEAGEPSESSLSGQRFSVGLTPFGHIGINVTDANGQTAGYMVTDVAEASQIAMHLTALTSMMYQNLYARAIAEQEAARQIMTQGGGTGLWTPGA